MHSKVSILHLAQILAKSQVLILFGPKMVGKKFLSSQISQQLKKKLLSFDLSKKADQHKLIHPDLVFSAHQDRLILLIGIEYFPSIITDIQSFQSKSKKRLHFILTTDFRFDRIFQNFSVPKKWIIREVFTQSRSASSNETASDLWQHWLRGGFPGFLTAPSHRMLMARGERLIQEIIQTNTRAIFGYQLLPEKIRRCLELVAQLNGSVLNSQLLSRHMGVSGPTAYRYLNFLEAAMLVRLLPALEYDAGKRLFKAPKIYIRDTGILHHLRGIQTLRALSASVQQSDSWESYIIEEVARQLPDKFQLSFYRTQHAAEIQLVVTKNSISTSNPKIIATIAIQTGALPQLSRALQHCISDLGAKKNFILHAASTPASQHHLPDSLYTRLKSANISVVQLPELLILMNSWR